MQRMCRMDEQLNTARNERHGRPANDCVCIPMNKRAEYEQALLAVKKQIEESNQMKSVQIAELDRLRRELECEQQELLELSEKLHRLAVTDGLTGLYNRRSMQKHLTEAVILHKHQPKTLTFLLLGIGHLKHLNDTYGRPTGDGVQQQLGQLLREEAGDKDFAARYGGEEFAIILSNTSKQQALTAAERVRSLIEHADWEPPKIIVSIGVSTFWEDDTENALQLRADHALYTSKKRPQSHNAQLRFGRLDIGFSADVFF